MRVSEFFYSVQGEGVSAGVPAVFVRFPGCNLMCGGPGGSLVVNEKTATWWCDTEAVWRGSRELDAGEMLKSLPEVARVGLKRNNAHLVITGGEPTMPGNEESFWELIDELDRQGIYPPVEIETNATIMAKEMLYYAHQINASPKLSNSGMPDAIRRGPEVVEVLNQKRGAWFKFVVSNEEDIKENEVDWITALGVDPSRIILMPACESIDTLPMATRFAMEAARDRGWRSCSRLQILAWNRTVGV